MPPVAPKTPEAKSASKACFLLLAAVLFNAFLAIINAHAVALNGTLVTLFQGMILACTGIFVWLHKSQLRKASMPMGFFLASVFLFLVVSAANQGLYLKALGDMAIIPFFFMLGGLSDEKTLLKTFRFLCWMIGLFMVLEIASTNAYVSLFHPAEYYANTRGLEQSRFNDTGLFANALGYQGRFSFGLSDHRLASVFLEQVSLAGFAMVLCMVAIAFWGRLSRFDRLLFAGTILLSIAGTSSRTAILFLGCLIPGYFLFPRMPKKSAALIIPAVLFFSALFFYDPGVNKDHFSDTMSGRIGLTMAYLSDFNIVDLFLGNLKVVYETMDSGYTYLLCTQTIFGFILFWLFTSLSVPGVTPENKRFALSMNIYFGVCLLTGAAIFSIKTNAPLLFVAGYLQNQIGRKNV